MNNKKALLLIVLGVIVLGAVGLSFFLKTVPIQATPAKEFAATVVSATPAPPEKVPDQVPDKQENTLTQITGNPNVEAAKSLMGMSVDERKQAAFRLSVVTGNQIKVRAFFKAWGEIDASSAFRAVKDFKTLPQKEAALQGVCEGVSPGNAAQLVTLFENPDPQDISASLAQDLLALILGKWATFDPQSAAAFLRTHDGLNQQIYSEIGKRWAETDPRAALEWAGQQDEHNKRNIMVGVLQSWVARSPNEAAQYAVEHVSDELTGVSNAATVASALAGRDPTAAKAFVESLPVEAREQAVMDAAKRLALDDPAGTAAWVERLNATQAIGAVMSQYAVRDPEGAREWISRLPEQSRNLALGAYATSVQDQVDGILTALRITNDVIRTQVARQVAGHWLSVDASGFRQWMATSGLPPETQAMLSH